MPGTSFQLPGNSNSLTDSNSGAGVGAGVGVGAGAGVDVGVGVGASVGEGAGGFAQAVINITPANEAAINPSPAFFFVIDSSFSVCLRLNIACGAVWWRHNHRVFRVS